MPSTDTRPTSIRLPPDLSSAIERTSREHDRTPADQHRHLLRLGLKRLAEIEALAQSNRGAQALPANKAAADNP